VRDYANDFRLLGPYYKSPHFYCCLPAADRNGCLLRSSAPPVIHRPSKVPRINEEKCI
jgi:hypothetical protein